MAEIPLFVDIYDLGKKIRSHLNDSVVGKNKRAPLVGKSCEYSPGGRFELWMVMIRCSVDMMPEHAVVFDIEFQVFLVFGVSCEL